VEVALHFVPQELFLQLFFVEPGPVITAVVLLQPPRTFSSGVPLPRTINWGWIHFFRLSSMFPLIGMIFHSSLILRGIPAKSLRRCGNGVALGPGALNKIFLFLAAFYGG
jgi:hypothetical protein